MRNGFTTGHGCHNGDRPSKCLNYLSVCQKSGSNTLLIAPDWLKFSSSHCKFTIVQGYRPSAGGGEALGTVMASDVRLLLYLSLVLLVIGGGTLGCSGGGWGAVANVTEASNIIELTQSSCVSVSVPAQIPKYSNIIGAGLFRTSTYSGRPSRDKQLSVFGVVRSSISLPIGGHRLGMSAGHVSAAHRVSLEVFVILRHCHCQQYTRLRCLYSASWAWIVSVRA